MNTPHVIQGTPSPHGDVLTAISDGMVALLKEFYGRGPTRAKSYYQDDLVVCVLRGGFSRVEETLLEGGRGHAVIQQRMEFQEVMRDRFTDVIEQATGRPVIGFMSGNQQHPDLMCEVFILGPTTSSTSTRSRARSRPRLTTEARLRPGETLLACASRWKSARWAAPEHLGLDACASQRTVGQRGGDGGPEILGHLDGLPADVTRSLRVCAGLVPG